MLRFFLFALFAFSLQANSFTDSLHTMHYENNSTKKIVDEMSRAIPAGTKILLDMYWAQQCSLTVKDFETFAKNNISTPTFGELLQMLIHKNLNNYSDTINSMHHNNCENN